MISIIIPVFNVENYLTDCINSILQSTIQDFEIILIDDGSTDNSGKICDNFAQKDQRIIVKHQTNQGLSAARNQGLEFVHGDYISFIDSDDFIHPKMYEILLSHLLMNTDCDFSMCYAIQTSKNLQNTKFQELTEPFDCELLGTEELLQNLFSSFNDDTNYQQVFTKLYKKELINHKFNINFTMSEDTLFNCGVYLNTQKAIICKCNLYYWVQRNTSLTHQSYSKRDIDVLKVYKLCYDKIPNTFAFAKDRCLEKTIKLFLNIRYHVRNNKIQKEYLKTIGKDININYLKSIFSLKYTKLSIKLILSFFLIFPQCYSLLLSYNNWRAGRFVN